MPLSGTWMNTKPVNLQKTRHRAASTQSAMPAENSLAVKIAAGKAKFRRDAAGESDAVALLP